MSSDPTIFIVFGAVVVASLGALVDKKRRKAWIAVLMTVFGLVAIGSNSLKIVTIMAGRADNPAVCRTLGQFPLSMMCFLDTKNDLRRLPGAVCQDSCIYAVDMSKKRMVSCNLYDDPSMGIVCGCVRGMKEKGYIDTQPEELQRHCANLRVAMRNGEAAFCEGFAKESAMENMVASLCFGLVIGQAKASKGGIVVECIAVQSTFLRDVCNSLVGMQLADRDACEQVSDEDTRRKCLASIGS